MDNRWNKKELRLYMLRKRAELTEKECKEKSLAITKLLLATKEYQLADRIFLYADYNNEVKTKEIFNDAIKKGKRVAYPVSYIKDTVACMDFYYVNHPEELKSGYKGIMEPDAKQLNLEKVESFEGLCLVPGLAFDKKGNRMGYGKGFYDRFLSEHEKLEKIALCYELQLVEDIPTDEYDVPMDMVITENDVKREKYE